MFGLARLLRNEDAVTIQIGHVLSFSILIIFVAIILLSFNSQLQSSANQAMRVGFAALGNDIARDITNLHLIGDNATIKRDIPQKIGGEVYYINAENSTLSLSSSRVTVNISIENMGNISGTASSASGEITLYQPKQGVIILA